MIKSFLEYIKEDSSTTASVGSGSAVSGGATGNFTSAAGVSVYGGDSGTAFATNSTMNGMGAIVSPQPSQIPGDVRGSTKGSGDIGSVLNTYTKQPAYANRKKGKKEDKKMENTDKKLKDLYVVKFSEFDGVKNVKENVYVPPTKCKCQECGDEVDDDIHSQLGHVYNKHWAQNGDKLKEYEPKVMVTRFFHKSK